ncbi:hypothetical protein JS532_05565 [Bifidobacterium callimiconis]|uniref:hypothetical protein n=1 Tax=Bifidobacterium callimiconis TaxID=2306973 RepID=UPI001BDDAD72|nr:hypothetical protein [Bifidobacterium callimiconis]MBT1177037.1 hypothetical protein [Bifidobacterium callimiconis]
MNTHTTATKILTGVMVSIMLLAGTTACGDSHAQPSSVQSQSTQSPSQKSPDQQDDKIITIEPSYGKGRFPNYKELIEFSDVFIEGDIVARDWTVRINGDWCSRYQVDVRSIVYWNWDGKGSWKSYQLKQGRIRVYQDGGIKYGETYQVDGDPLFKIGDHELMYLTVISESSGTYYVPGGSEGRFSVSADGSLKRIGKSFPEGTPPSTVQEAMNQALEIKREQSERYRTYTFETLR